MGWGFKRDYTTQARRRHITGSIKQDKYHEPPATRQGRGRVIAALQLEVPANP